MFGLKVRGQRTRTTGRKGGAVGVAKGGKVMPAKGGAGAPARRPLKREESLLKQHQQKQNQQQKRKSPQKERIGEDEIPNYQEEFEKTKTTIKL